MTVASHLSCFQILEHGLARSSGGGLLVQALGQSPGPCEPSVATGACIQYLEGRSRGIWSLRSSMATQLEASLG